MIPSKGAQPQDKPPLGPMVLAMAAALTLTLLAGWASWTRAVEADLAETARRGDNVLQLAVSSLTGQLERFERLPSLIADQPKLHDLLQSPDDTSLVSIANSYLQQVQRQLDAADVYLMDRKGLTIAASNHGQTPTFLGRNFAFRPYFYDALSGGLGRFYALGTTSGKRGYYIGAPVKVGGQISGVLVFKIDLDAIEEDWRGGDYAVLVTDPDGVIFLASRQDWLFHALRPLTEAARREIVATQRYADTPIQLLKARLLEEDAQYQRVVIEGAEYVQRSAAMAQAGWQVQVLIDTAAARRSAAMAAILAVLAGGVHLDAGNLGAATTRALGRTAAIAGRRPRRSGTARGRTHRPITPSANRFGAGRQAGRAGANVSRPEPRI